MDTEYWEQQEKRAKELKEERARQSESYKKLEAERDQLRAELDRAQYNHESYEELCAERDNANLSAAAWWGEAEHLKGLFKQANALKRKYFDWYTGAAGRIIALRVYEKIEIVERLLAQVKQVEAERDAARQSRRRLVWWIHEVGRRDDLLDDAIEAMTQAQQDARELANALHFMLLLWASVDAEHKVMAAPAKEELMKIVDVEWSIGAKYLEQPPSESDS